MKKNYIGIREARINLSRLIRDVKGGMEIVITERGTPVARLIPAQGASLSLEERLKNYTSCGLIDLCPHTVRQIDTPVEIPAGAEKQSITGEDING